MKVTTIERDGITVAVADGEGEMIITDPQSALDFIMTTRVETGAMRVVLDKASVVEAFFDLRTGIAGECLQKFSNYRMKLAIYGDFSGYESRALREFITECNRGRDIFFASDVEDACERLANAK